MEPTILSDGLHAAMEYARMLAAKDPTSKYLSLNWNFLPTAAASLMHPHFQMVGDTSPTKYVGESLEASASYLRMNASSYWDDLVVAEKAVGERFVADSGPFSWLASYAPMGNNESIGIAKSASHFLQLEEADLEGMAEGLSAILRTYDRIGVQGLNMAVYSGPLGVGTAGFSLHVRVISRPKLKQLYTSDAGFMERLHDEVIVETKPEDFAAELRKSFGPLSR